MALQRIGARGTIGSLTEDSPNAIKVNVVWDMIFQEVLSERDWKFAKTRVELQQNATQPVGGYKYAYPLPADFLRLCRPREIPENERSRWRLDHHRRDLPVAPREVHPYITETVLGTGIGGSYTTNLLTNYPYDCVYPLPHPIIINYIRLITDFTQLLPGFVNCLANRLAAELSIAITEDKSKLEGFMEMYRASLNSAQAQTECDDFLQDESGNYDWSNAGRFRRGYW